ncbi:DnaJ C-terminal domain-containing protein, partial [Klebsiella pneumoniae]|uniref:DnaJ C-terminal domain-containing protein n=1 Tax=Klebsiella pneumoniae TaxID=573 RepID=UPI003013D866
GEADEAHATVTGDIVFVLQQKEHPKFKKVLEVVVEKGMQNGQKSTFPGEADEAPDTVTGDIVFVLQQKEHPKFKRKGD